MQITAIPNLGTATIKLTENAQTAQLASSLLFSRIRNEKLLCVREYALGCEADRSQANGTKAVSPKHKCIAGGGSLNKAHLCRESEWESDRQDSVVIRGVKVRCRDLVPASDC